MVDNNKNRIKDRPKTKAEMRKIQPKDHADLGIENGKIIGTHSADHEKGDS